MKSVWTNILVLVILVSVISAVAQVNPAQRATSGDYLVEIPDAATKKIILDAIKVAREDSEQEDNAKALDTLAANINNPANYNFVPKGTFIKSESEIDLYLPPEQVSLMKSALEKPSANDKTRTNNANALSAIDVSVPSDKLKPLEDSQGFYVRDDAGNPILVGPNGEKITGNANNGYVAIDTTSVKSGQNLIASLPAGSDIFSPGSGSLNSGGSYCDECSGFCRTG